jgi:hypothetical protein
VKGTVVSDVGAGGGMTVLESCGRVNVLLVLRVAWKGGLDDAVTGLD